jgi:hypothetical protein
MVIAAPISFFPPLEKGRVGAEGARVGFIRLIPTRQALLADLPLAGGGMKRSEI